MDVASLADKLGTSDAALRLLLGILAAYPIAVVYRNIIEKAYPVVVVYRNAAENQKSTSIKHSYLTLCGLAIGYFNYGNEICHSIIAMLGAYLIMHLLQFSHPKLMVALNWCFQMTYLLVGYYYTEHNDYDISWTMSQCVLTLRLIGLAFDVADSKKPIRSLSDYQAKVAIPRAPGLLELSTYVYFPSAFLVGPQFPIYRMQSFINGEYRKYSGKTIAALKRTALGVLYLTFYYLLSSYFPNDYFVSEEYFAQPLYMKLCFMGIWGKLTLCKYVAIWLLAEGSLILIGFTFNGTNECNEADWSGCANVRLALLETEDSMAHYVQSFNVNTNEWLSNYTYKRLKFLNNRTLSYGGALFFLALWHGFHDGYYMAFLFEFMIVTTEKQVKEVYDELVVSEYGDILSDSILYHIVWKIMMRIYNYIFMGWCLCPFILLSYDRWIPAFRTVYFYGFVYCGLWFVFYQLYCLTCRDSARKNRNKAR